MKKKIIIRAINRTCNIIKQGLFIKYYGSIGYNYKVFDQHYQEVIKYGIMLYGFYLILCKFILFLFNKIKLI